MQNAIMRCSGRFFMHSNNTFERKSKPKISEQFLLKQKEREEKIAKIEKFVFERWAEGAGCNLIKKTLKINDKYLWSFIPNNCTHLYFDNGKYYHCDYDITTGEKSKWAK